VPHLIRIVAENNKTHSRDQIVKAFPPLLDRQVLKKAKVADSSTAPVKHVDKQRRNNRIIDGKVDVEALRSALACLAKTPNPKSKHGATFADDYDTWVRFGLAIKRALGDDGFELWDEWARASRLYPGEGESRAKWDRSFDISARSGDDAITVGTIFHYAKRHGWSFTRHAVASSLANALKTFRAK
jgi:hypothetical protein